MVPRMVPKIISFKSTYSELSNALSNVFISQKLTEIQLFKVRYNYPVQVNILTSSIYTSDIMILSAIKNLPEWYLRSHGSYGKCGETMKKKWIYLAKLGAKSLKIKWPTNALDGDQIRQVERSHTLQVVKITFILIQIKTRYPNPYVKIYYFVTWHGIDPMCNFQEMSFLNSEIN